MMLAARALAEIIGLRGVRFRQADSSLLGGPPAWFPAARRSRQRRSLPALLPGSPAQGRSARGAFCQIVTGTEEMAR